MTTRSLPPQQLGDYTLTEVQAKGGMGIVYRARDQRSGRDVALKTVFSDRESHVSSIRREIEVLQRIRHPGVVEVFDSGLHEGVPWYAMELLQGHTLRDLLKKGATSATVSDQPTSGGSTSERSAPPPADLDVAEPPVPLEDALGLVRQICEPLAFLHGEGVVHRDLKPSNVFLRDGSEPVLVDFGLVQRFGGTTTREQLVEGEGPPAGTVSYMSPEQLVAGVVDPRSDLYALGCILYELLVGRPPFAGSAAVLTHLHMNSEPVRASELVPGIPSTIDRLLNRMLAKRPADRIGYAADVGAALERTGRCSVPPAPTAPPRARAYLYRPGLAGRTESLEQLIDALSDPVPRLVSIRGESGVGKTRLATELARRARGKGFRVVKGVCLPMPAVGVGVSAAAPLHPFRAVLQDMVDHCRAYGPAETERVLGPRATLLATYEPAIASVADVDGARVATLASAEASRLRLYTWLATTLSEFARDAPLLLLIDDAQWADEVTLGFLLAIGTGAASMQNVHVVCTCRSSSEAARDLAGLERVRDLVLGPLSPAEVRDLVADMLAWPEPPAALVERVAELSGGNPFYVSEYLHAAVELDLLRRDAVGSWELGDHPDRALPRSVAELVTVRMGTYDQPTRELLELVSAFRTDVPADLLARTATVSEGDLLAYTGELIAREILTEENGTLRFSHRTLGDTVYESLDAEHRVALHRGIARSLSDSGSDDHRALALHWDGAAEPDRAVSSYLSAAVEAQRLAASAQARELFERAFRLADAGAAIDWEGLERVELETIYAETLFGTGDLEGAHRQLRDVLTKLGLRVPETRAGWSAVLAREGARQTIRAWRPVGERRGEEGRAAELALRALDLLASVMLASADTLGQLGVTLLAVNLADTADVGPSVAGSYARMALMVGLLGREAAAERYLARAQRAASASGQGQPRIYMAEALLSLCRARWQRLAEITEPALRACSVAGDLQTEAQIHVFRAGAATVRGRAADALAITERAIPRAERLGYRLELTHLTANRAAGFLLQRRSADARECLASLEGLVAEGGDPVGTTLHRVLLAVCALVEGDPGLARRDGDRALAALAEAPAGSPGYLVHCLFLPPLYLSLFESGDEGGLTEARRCMKRLDAQARLQPAGRPAAKLYRGIMARLRGRRRSARRLLTTAADQAARLGTGWTEAAALWELARVGGDGATANRERARELLARAGAADPPFYVVEG